MSFQYDVHTTRQIYTTKANPQQLCQCNQHPRFPQPPKEAAEAAAAAADRPTTPHAATPPYLTPAAPPYAVALPVHLPLDDPAHL